MEDLSTHGENIAANGFTVINDIYSNGEVEAIIKTIAQAGQSNLTFRKTEDLFAIRQLLKEIPEVKRLVFNNRFKDLLSGLFGESYFIVKSIYFDKPEKSNWFVAWHQDLTISVDKKVDLRGYGPWSTKLNQFAVQPPVDILQDNFTVRIHLDDTGEGNGALKVIAGSHLKNIWRTDDFNHQTETETSCNVQAGGMMIMRPLLMHASSRTTNNKQRRVIHIELSRTGLPGEIQWAEKELF